MALEGEGQLPCPESHRFLHLFPGSPPCFPGHHRPPAAMSHPGQSGHGDTTGLSGWSPEAYRRRPYTRQSGESLAVGPSGKAPSGEETGKDTSKETTEMSWGAVEAPSRLNPGVRIWGR
ncbi:unnamed protein product [Rangifer tarandus platyrhynchus]|uniref:Uncharacterized protein n=1 Tax=Rangifer tarandus platyrhynchus TaxID=3082113 RepID=A0AC59YGA8_RANTA